MSKIRDSGRIISQAQMNTFREEKLKNFLFLLIILLLRPAFDKKWLFSPVT